MRVTAPGRIGDHVPAPGLPADRPGGDAITAPVPDIDPQPLGTGRRLPLGVLRQRQFALLFAGQAVSVLGDRLVLVALPFAVLSVGGATAADVGLVLGAGALTLALFVLVGGVWADRLPRQLTMLGSDVVRAVVQAVTAGLLLTGSATVELLVALQAVYGAAEAFFRPAVLGLVPQVVDEGRIQEANALLALTTNVAMVAGPAAAGALVATAGPGATLAVDAATFVVSAVTLALLRPRRTAAPAPASSFRADLRDGWREVRARSWVWTVILAFAAYHAFVLASLFVLGPIVSERSRGGAGAWGLITAGFGAGAVAGSLVALRWRPRRPGVVIGALLAVASTQSAICASALPTVAVAALEFVTGACVSVLFTVWETALQERIPAAAQSRVSSFDYLGSLTLVPLGFVLVGPVSEALGVVPTAVTASVVSLAVALVVAAGRPLRALRRMDAATAR